MDCVNKNITQIESNTDELDQEDNQTMSFGSIENNEQENAYRNNQIKVDKGFYTCFELKRKFEKDEPGVILDSDFQREDVWTIKQKRELIESVLMDLPLPIFYFNEDQNGRLIVIDGRQRLTSLFEFMSNKFHLDNLKIFNDFDKKNFNDLAPVYQTKIEDYQIMANIIKPPTPDNIKFDIFDRVNRAGTQLNKQEIRNALYQGNATQLLNTLSSLEEFQIATENSFKNDKRMKSKYILLRFIAFYLFFENKLTSNNEQYNYNGDIDEFLGVVMEYLNKCNDKELDRIKNTTKDSLQKIIFYIPKDAFRLIEIENGKTTKRYSININIFENLMYAMTLIPDNNIKLKNIVEEKFTKMKLSEKFKDLIRNHRDSENKVIARKNIILKIVGEINDTKN